MSKHPVEASTVQLYIEARRARVLSVIDRAASPPVPTSAPLSAEQLAYLLHEAEDLFWNELSWEELTDEERIGGGHLTEMVFPCFLSFVDGLLLQKVPADSPAPARPHPVVVEEILGFLGERSLEFTRRIEAGADSEKLVRARAMTACLIDLVLFRLYQLTPEERELVQRGE